MLARPELLPPPSVVFGVLWRKRPDGHWRCVMDYSTPSPAAARGA